jgi:cytidylate kinase
MSRALEAWICLNGRLNLADSLLLLGEEALLAIHPRRAGLPSGAFGLFHVSLSLQSGLRNGAWCPMGRELTMSIVTISRGSYSRGKEVAEKLALALNYECLSREIVLEASAQFNIPEIRLVRAIHDAPSILDRFTYGKERYVAFFRAAFLKRVQKDNVVYHGLAGHFFLQGVPHVLKVRIIADLEDRVREETEREGISAEEARRILAKDDQERRKWGIHLYGADTWDPTLYDVVVHIDNMGVDDAVALILAALQRPCFLTTHLSQNRIDDLALSAQVEAALVSEFPKVSCTARHGEVFVSVRASLVEELSVTQKVKRIAERMQGVKMIHVNVVPFIIEE